MAAHQSPFTTEEVTEVVACLNTDNLLHEDSGNTKNVHPFRIIGSHCAEEQTLSVNKLDDGSWR